jgi:hypothetical protein
METQRQEGQRLVIPGPWDRRSARLLEALGFPARVAYDALMRAGREMPGEGRFGFTRTELTSQQRNTLLGQQAPQYAV